MGVAAYLRLHPHLYTHLFIKLDHYISFCVLLSNPHKLLFMHILIIEKAIPGNAVQLEEIPHPVRNRDAG